MWSNYSCLMTLIGLALILTRIAESSKINIGRLCTLPNGKNGQCKKFDNCWPAKRYYRNLARCNKRLICCDDLETANVQHFYPMTTSEIPGTRKFNPENSYGWLSKQKCQEYSKWQTDPTLRIGAGKIRGVCAILIAPTIVGGEKARPMEFPHMANLGYQDGSGILFACGASLISEQFLLTAAHCVRSEHGNTFPKIARFTTYQYGHKRDYELEQRVFVHPNYRWPHKYNDIALLKLKRIIHFSDDIRPACLHTGNYIDHNKEAIATGWGFTEAHANQGTEYLMKVALPLVSFSECRKSNEFKLDARMSKGMDANSMMCAGGIKNKDTCGGDSGGPLQIRNKSDCMYTIIGITSSGNGVGEEVPAIYTKVSNYIPWIESIVWPKI